MFGDAEACNRFMCRWSHLVAPLLVDFTGLPDTGRVLDVGSGDKGLEGPGVVKVIEDPGEESGTGAGGIYPGPDLSRYAFVRRNLQRNLYRIPLP